MAEFTRQGQGTLNTVLGAVGTYGALGGGLGNIFGGNSGISMDFIDVKTENAILKSELNTEKKMVEVYNSLNDKINTVRSTMESGFSAQSVINCGFNSSIAVLQNQMNQVFDLTKLVIPSTSVCTSSTTTA